MFLHGAHLYLIYQLNLAPWCSYININKCLKLILRFNRKWCNKFTCIRKSAKKETEKIREFITWHPVNIQSGGELNLAVTLYTVNVHPPCFFLWINWQRDRQWVRLGSHWQKDGNKGFENKRWLVRHWTDNQRNDSVKWTLLGVKWHG